MFHKRLIKEFRENQKNIWGMVLTQWVMLIANVVLMLQTATFIAGMVRGEKSAKPKYQAACDVGSCWGCTKLDVAAQQQAVI